MSERGGTSVLMRRELDHGRDDRQQTHDDDADDSGGDEKNMRDLHESMVRRITVKPRGQRL
ncbi:MAG: hypothetical protein QOF52_176 [Propionibacteriaceae bacterium]|jgi:hypothetical protein|nr:hypothetical protein [Propionibacteriaceae bacterium]MDX6320318.1 hypothetical protein [Propionibacteriaceae bacterium]